MEASGDFYRYGNLILMSSCVHIGAWEASSYSSRVAANKLSSNAQAPSPHANFTPSEFNSMSMAWMRAVGAFCVLTITSEERGKIIVTSGLYSQYRRYLLNPHKAATRSLTMTLHLASVAVK